jgi:lysine 6-dehydrogenase
MGYRYAVLGAGRQGIAIAYDLVRHGEAETVLLSDVDEAAAAAGAQRINALTGRTAVAPARCDAADPASLRAAVGGVHAVASALPYFLNVDAARAAIEAGAHFADLGGNTAIVLEELRLHRAAVLAGVSCLPDCGLAPGLSNLLAARALERLDRVRAIRARCGGLPQRPRPPFGYKLVFSPHGLLNEYSGEAIVLRKGKIAKIPALTEPEALRIPGVGRLEASVTSGGTSTAPYSFRGRVRDFDYKTLRYPGHFQAFRAFTDLGLLRPESRDILIAHLRPLIDFPKDRDLVVLRVNAEGTLRGRRRRYTALLIDRGDRRTGFTAMERTTAYPTSTIVHLQARGWIAAGATPIEKAVPLEPLLAGLARRGVRVRESLR